MKGQSCLNPSLGVGSCGLPLDVTLFTQFVWKIAEGEATEEIWSSVYFFISTSSIYGKNEQVILCDQKIWKEC